jgi:hypothetical protein
MTEHEESECGHPHLRTRTLLELVLDDDDTLITVGHVYLPEGAAGTCDSEGCGNPIHDPGMVMLATNEECGLLTAEQALVIAHQIQRAASLVLLSGEEPADIEREAARYAAPARNQE